VTLKVSDYTFNITTIGEFNNRLEILFRNTALNTDNQIVNNDKLIITNKTETSIHVKMINGTIITKLKTYDVLGKLVINIAPNKNDFIINTSFNQGTVLFIKAELENGSVLTHKFLKY